MKKPFECNGNQRAPKQSKPYAVYIHQPSCPVPVILGRRYIGRRLHFGIQNPPHNEQTFSMARSFPMGYKALEARACGHVVFHFTLLMTMYLSSHCYLAPVPESCPVMVSGPSRPLGCFVSIAVWHVCQLPLAELA